MKLSFDWLGDFVDLSGLTPQEVADKLTMGAFEVEEIRSFGPDIRGPLVVGQIIEINPHPNADKIRLTKVVLEEGQEPREIVCGAWNIEVGHKIPVALPGAKVVNRHDGSALDIKENKIRGVVSNGMLCSPPELGLSGGGEGILILDPGTAIGINAKDFLEIRNDYVLIVEPRSNRGDALSVLGLAREVAALFGRPLKKQEWIEEFAEFKSRTDLPQVKVAIENTEDCPYFTVRTLADIKIGPSPAQIQRRLEAIGIKTISNMVDITNYVMHELGQPLHAYDMRRVQGSSLSVRRAKEASTQEEQESLITIDDKERKLPGEALVIADGERVVGVAGVMGGKESEISDDTSLVALEAASFTPARVRRSSRLIGLSSDSSLRFERGVDTASVKNASNRAAYLMVKHGNAALGELSTAGSDQIQKSKIKIRMSELKRLCEIDIGSDAAGDLLEPLGFKSVIASDDYHAGILTVEVPSFRMKDVCREVDLVEEITRLYGYERLPISMPSNTLAAVPIDPVPGKIRQSLCGSGLSEAWLSSLTSFDDLALRQNSNVPKNSSEKSEPKEANTEKNDTTVGVLNPLSAEHQVLRQSLIPGLIKAASYNQDRGNASPWLFELGKAYYRSKSEKQQSRLPEHKQTFAREEDLVSGIVVGEPVISSWLEEKSGVGSDDLHRSDSRAFYLIKGIFENLAAVLHIPSGGIKYEDHGEFPSCFHPGRSARVVFSAPETGSDKSDKSEKTDVKKKPGRKGGAITLGYLGELHPAVADDYKLNGRAAAMELNIQSLKESMGKQMFAEIFVTPTMQRDLTIDLDNSVKNQDVELSIYASGEETLRRIELVSIFRLSDKKKSLSYRLTFQHASQTLTAESVDAIMAKVREQLSLKLQAEFRL